MVAEAPARSRLADVVSDVDGLDIIIAVSTVLLAAGLWLLLGLSWALTVIGGLGLAVCLFALLVEKLAAVRRAPRDREGR